MKHPARLLLTLLRVALGVGLLYYILSKTGGWVAARQFTSITWLLPALVILTIFGAAIETMRLGLLLKSQDIHLSFSNGFRLVIIGGFFNFAIPGGTGGDAMKLYYLATENRGRGVELAIVLLVDRAVALFALLSLMVGLALLNWQLVLSNTPIRWLVIAGAMGMLGLLAGVIISFSTRLRKGKWYAPVMAGMPFGRLLERAFEALYTFRDHKTALLGAAIWSLVGHIGLVSMFLVMGLVLIPKSSSLITALLSLLGMLANALPITPGGLGVGEAAFDGLFSLAGYAGGAQLILAWRLGMIPISMAGGLLYIKGVRSRRNLTNQIEKSALMVQKNA